MPRPSADALVYKYSSHPSFPTTNSARQEAKKTKEEAMARLTPPCTPLSTFSTNSSTKTSRSSKGSSGPGVSVIHSINSFWAKCTRAAKKMATNSPKSPLAKPKHLFLTLSNKAIIFKNKKKVENQFEGDDEAEIDFGDGGLWQRDILMGDKCQPLDFSGVIYYDSNGKQLSELPMKSPRASPLPSYLYTSSEKN